MRWLFGGASWKEPPIEPGFLRLRHRRAARRAAAFGITAATIPIVLCALEGSSSAATSSQNGTFSTQQAVADAQCDIAWLEWDVAISDATPGPPIPPSCTPVPADLPQVINDSNCDEGWLVYDIGDAIGPPTPSPSYCTPLPVIPEGVAL